MASSSVSGPLIGSTFWRMARWSAWLALSRSAAGMGSGVIEAQAARLSTVAASAPVRSRWDLFLWVFGMEAS
jgi:hypothetical protein